MCSFNFSFRGTWGLAASGDRALAASGGAAPRLHRRKADCRSHGALTMGLLASRAIPLPHGSPSVAAHADKRQVRQPPQPSYRYTRAHAAGSARNGHASPHAGRAARSVMPIAALHPTAKQSFALIPPKCPPLRCEGGTWGGCKTGKGPFSHVNHPTHPQPPPCWRGLSPPSAPLRGERGETQARGCILKTAVPPAPLALSENRSPRREPHNRRRER
jgi:hypothetical protein